MDSYIHNIIKNLSNNSAIKITDMYDGNVYVTNVNKGIVKISKNGLVIYLKKLKY